MHDRSETNKWKMSINTSRSNFLTSSKIQDLSKNLDIELFDENNNSNSSTVRPARSRFQSMGSALFGRQYQNQIDLMAQESGTKQKRTRNQQLKQRRLYQKNEIAEQHTSSSIFGPSNARLATHNDNSYQTSMLFRSIPRIQPPSPSRPEQLHEKYVDKFTSRLVDPTCASRSSDEDIGTQAKMWVSATHFRNTGTFKKNKFLIQSNLSDSHKMNLIVNPKVSHSKFKKELKSRQNIIDKITRRKKSMEEGQNTVSTLDLILASKELHNKKFVHLKNGLL